MLTVTDEYTREALCGTASRKMVSAEVLAALYPLLPKQRKPEFIRSDNGSGSASEGFQTWLKKVGVKSKRIYSGSRWENRFNERFNGILSREVLNAEWIVSIEQARTVIERWLKQ